MKSPYESGSVSKTMTPERSGLDFRVRRWQLTLSAQHLVAENTAVAGHRTFGY
jgi:hypothetical protein